MASPGLKSQWGHRRRQPRPLLSDASPGRGGDVEWPRLHGQRRRRRPSGSFPQGRAGLGPDPPGSTRSRQCPRPSAPCPVGRWCSRRRGRDGPWTLPLQDSEQRLHPWGQGQPGARGPEGAPGQDGLGAVGAGAAEEDPGSGHSFPWTRGRSQTQHGAARIQAGAFSDVFIENVLNGRSTKWRRHRGRFLGMCHRALSPPSLCSLR